MDSKKTKGGEARKRQLAKEVLIVTDENEIPVTTGSKVVCYLTRGMAQAAVQRMQGGYPNITLQVTEFVPKSSRLIFMDADEEVE